VEQAWLFEVSESVVDQSNKCPIGAFSKLTSISDEPLETVINGQERKSTLLSADHSLVQRNIAVKLRSYLMASD
jgi:hypothetical protein